MFESARARWKTWKGSERPRPRIALALSGGGVIGGMYQVGALAALEEKLNGAGRGFDVYVGCSAGAVVASMLANGVPARELYQILDEDLDDPLNFRRGAVFSSGSARRALTRLLRLVWVLGKHAAKGRHGSVPDMMSRAHAELPPGFFSLAALESFIRGGLASRGLSNDFSGLPRTLLIPAIDIDRAERVVFGRGALRQVPISEAVAASSAIPGFFEPYRIAGRDYMDGGVGFSGHADLAAEAGVDLIFVIHPLVPSLPETEGDAPPPPPRLWSLSMIMEQASRINGRSLLQLGLEALAIKHPRTRFVLLKPAGARTPLFGPALGFGAGRAALHYWYESTRAWLEADGLPLITWLSAASAGRRSA